MIWQNKKPASKSKSKKKKKIIEKGELFYVM